MSVNYSPNELIIFVKKNKPVLGSVCAFEKDTITVLSEDGKEVDISPDQVELRTSIVFDSDPNSSVRKLALRGYRKDLNKSSKEIDLKFLWECVAGSVEKVSFNDILEIYYGEKSFQTEDILNLYWAINRDPVYFTKENGLYFPVDEPEVKKKLREIEKEKRKIEETTVAVNWFNNFINDNENNDSDEHFDKDYFINMIKQYVIARGSKESLREPKSFVHQLGINRVEDATELLIRLGEWGADADPDLKRLEDHEKFSKKSLDETKDILNKGFDTGDFEDLTSKDIFTIDDADTEDIDDAISIEINSGSIELGIHICNVAYYVPKGSSLDTEACVKGDTVYIPDKRVDIFPKELIIEKFSLFEDREKLAVSLIIELDKKTYEIKNYRFVKSVISVSKNISYEEAERDLLKEKRGKELVNIAMALRKKRIMKGAFVLQLPELKFRIDNNGIIETYKNYMNSIPHMIIAELMILTNNLSAKFINDHKIPSIFRVQSEEIPNEAREFDPTGPLYSIRVVKHLRPSIISTNTGPHKSLGLDAYVQVTSPIRRYFDLVAQRQIIGILEGNEWIYDGKELFEIISKITNGFGERRLLQKNRRKYWLYKYFRDNENIEIKGIVSSVNETDLSVYLPEFLVEIPVKNYNFKNFKEYDEVSLKVGEVDPLRKRLILQLAEPV